MNAEEKKKHPSENGSFLDKMEDALNVPELVDERTGTRVPHWLRRIIFFLLFITIFPAVLFQIPQVQSWAAHKLAKYLSRELNTAVMVDKVSIGLLSNATLSKFYVEDQFGDTLLYVNSLEIKHTGLFSLFSRSLTINSLRLSGGGLHLSRMANSEEFNYTFLLDYFTPMDTSGVEGANTPFKLDIKHLSVENVNFIKSDTVSGNFLAVGIGKGEAFFRKFDPEKKVFDLRSLQLYKPVVRIVNSGETPQEVPVEEQRMFVVDQLIDTAELLVNISRFELQKGAFSLHNNQMEPVRQSPDSALNFRHLDLTDIQIRVSDFSTSNLNFYGKVDKIACKSSSGFGLESLSAESAAVTCNGIELYGLNIKTPDSEIGDTLIFRYNTYSAWSDFENEVSIIANFKNASVTLSDILEFVPSLEENTFFHENRKEAIRLSAVTRGPVNRLDAKNVVIDLAKGVHISGRFSTLNLAVPDEQFVHLNLNKLSTSIFTLRKLLPGFSPSENFNRLGNILFSGKFDGFFEDFVADGKLKTDIGHAEMFMNLKVRDGKENARYSGDLYLRNFDMGKWMSHPDWGQLTLNMHVKEGTGLTLASVNTQLEGVIDSMTYKNYEYRDIELKGHLQKDVFDGFLLTNDPNIDLRFDGAINFENDLPVFNFKTNVQNFEPAKLNLTKQDIKVSGEFNLDLQGSEISNIVGEGALKNVLVVKGGKDTIFIDEAYAQSVILDNGEKEFKINSTIGDVRIKGVYDIKTIPELFTGFIARHHPRFSRKLNIHPSQAVAADSSRFEFEINLKELQRLFVFFEEKLDGFDETSISGHYDGTAEELAMTIDVPAWSFGDINFEGLYFKADLNAGEGLVNLGVIKTILGNGQELAPVFLVGNIYGDTLEFGLIATNFTEILDNVSIDAVVTLDEDDAWFVQFQPGRIVLLNQSWRIDPNNYIKIGEGTVQTRNFLLTQGDKTIVIENVKSTGLQVQLENYPLDELDFIKNLPRHTIRGVGDLKLTAKNIFKLEGIALLLRVNALQVNGDDYGVFRLDALLPSPKQSVRATLSVYKDDMRLDASGYYNPTNYDPATDVSWIEPLPNYLDVRVATTDYPLHILEYFVEGISNVKGKVSAEDVRFYGQPDKLAMSGLANVRDASFRLIPVQVNYSIPTAKVQLSENMIDGTGNYIYDKNGNRAAIEGGLTHDYLHNLGVNLKVTTDPGRPFLGLATTDQDNPIFYGTAYVSGNITIKGSLRQPELVANGRSMPGTKIVIPLGNSSTAGETSFISFEGMHEEQNQPDEQTQLSGLDMRFNLELTPDANIELIFDKAWGDVIKGNGSGPIRVEMLRDGTFTIYGNYTVASGEYLFTLMNLLFNKAFTVEPGGTIVWSGDPYNAAISINAVYEGVNTSVYNFISEYLQLASSDIENSARSSTPVWLKMQLKGNLFKPDISFDFEFPALDTETRNLAENKLRIIRQDPNELNRQVFGLLVLGQFLPTDYSIQAGDVTINTLSEMLSNQLSIYFTEFLSELLAGTGIIQGIDLDLSYNRFDGSNFDGQTFVTGNEVQGKLKVYVNDRISIRARGNFEIDSGNSVYIANNGLVAHEFMIEYALTKDRRLKIRAYQSSEPDIAGGQRTKFGGGLSFRKEFNTFSELLSFFKNKSDKKKRAD